MWIKLRFHPWKNKLHEPHWFSIGFCLKLLLPRLFILFPVDFLHFYHILIWNHQIRHQISLFYSILIEVTFKILKIYRFMRSKRKALCPKPCWFYHFWWISLFWCFRIKQQTSHRNIRCSVLRNSKILGNLSFVRWMKFPRQSTQIPHHVIWAMFPQF